jgi:vacuolar-type H+-ATPase subunit F/Vma7
MEMLKVAGVGDSTSVAGVRPLGFDVRALDVPAGAREIWPELVSGEYAVVLVTEPVWTEIAELAAEIMDSAIPAVTVIPGAGSSGGVGQEKIDSAIIRALGTTSFIREEEA